MTWPDDYDEHPTEACRHAARWEPRELTGREKRLREARYSRKRAKGPVRNGAHRRGCRPIS